MKNIYGVLLLLLSLTGQMQAQHTFSGIVLDKANNEALTGAIVYIPDLKIGVAAGPKGDFMMTDLPARSFLVEVKFMGYESQQLMVDFNNNPVINFHLRLATIEAKGVVITGSAFSTDTRSSSFQVVPVDKRELMTSAATTIINELTHIPGISAISTGGAIAKPVIRGLGYNRVVTLYEGIRQEGNQWGDEHGIEIDQFSADRIEILKGPASLFYGSDAMGGVINILEPLPPPPGIRRGEFANRFSGNNKLLASSLMTEGNAKGFIWRARASYKNAAAYKTPSEYVYNSGYDETDLNAMLGLNKKWGYTHFHYSHFNTHIGLVEGERDSITRQFTDQDGKIVPDDVLKGRKLELPLQHISHDKFSTVNNIILGKSQVKINLGYQQNNRKEHAESRSDPNLFFQLQTLSYDAKLQLPLGNGFESVYGIAGMTQTNTNKGIEFLIPDYTLQDAGGFVYLKKNFRQLSLNGGIRYDHRDVEGKSLYLQDGAAIDTIFNHFSTDFSALSGSLGLAWKVNQATDIKFNIGRAFRAPNIAELGANGIHEGTFRYEIGNANLKPETSLQFDAGFDYNRDYFSLEISAYYNLINNFIYLRNIDNEEITYQGESYPAYRYVQGNSLIRGFEASLDIHPWDHIHFENSLALVRGTNQSKGTELPLIPATRQSHTIRWNIEIPKKSSFKNPYVYLGYTYTWQQNHYDEFETKTNAYGLWKAGLGTDVKISKQLMTIFVEVENLGNTHYADHLSRLKYAGIEAMGSNVTLGLNVPFGLNKGR